MRLAELQKSDAEAQKIRAEELKEGLGKYVDVGRCYITRGYRLYLKSFKQSSLVLRYTIGKGGGELMID